MITRSISQAYVLLCALSFNVKYYRYFSLGFLSFKVDNQQYSHFLNVRFSSPETAGDMQPSM